MKNSHLAIGIASSLAIGALIGVLFAPDKGCNTRRKISQKSKDLKDSLKDGIENLASAVENDYNKLVSKTENVIDGKKSMKNEMK